ncbi:uncharacterized protein B0I36DRAFT_376211 [Microdochium trichocladiopsis]|uniref:SWI5-dependent HO expression protein 3 n=1 Tax=Microdochium trichocladiopsis TaxID=1682393 RepID=A0A9P9BMN8_9PEZI|nr:uncharacterized protein B0I36DRAFT_376211 [Microdochium trichocladiopsis]KAH7026458.1 hypothetical protein B0I36DRAFT_376211 [Microdochium trichocladiopsis]
MQRSDSGASYPSKQAPTSDPANLAPPTQSRGNATIRTVASFETPSELSTSGTRSARSSGFSASAASDASGASDIDISNHHNVQPDLQRQPYNMSRFKSPSPGPESRFGRSPTTPEFSTNGDGLDEKTMSLQVPESNSGDLSGFTREGSPGWDGAVGKAGLGKTGRVINKLVADNDSLKREIKIERLKADEAKQSARLIEDKMDKLVADYESRLLEASVTKTLLARKERQVETLQAAVELEKKRTSDAQERERTWKHEMEQSRRETKVQVQEAVAQAALSDGRYNAIASHWRDQGLDVKRAAAKLDSRIKSLVEERQEDDERINTLRDLCDQQDGNIRELREQKEEISRQFEAYKRQQEEALQEIKRSAREREETQRKTLEEAKEVLDKLKWALNVKQTVAGAQ